MQAKAQAKPLPRKRQSEANPAQEGGQGSGKPKQAKNMLSKAQEAQVTLQELADQRRSAQQAGFASIFRIRTQAPQGEPQLLDQDREGSGAQAIPIRNHRKQAEPVTTGTDSPSQRDRGPRLPPGEGYREVQTSNRFALLTAGRQAEEVATKADIDRMERIRDSWDQESRNEDLAQRKQEWHAGKIRKVTNHSFSSGEPHSGEQGSGTRDRKHAQAAAHQSSGSGAQTKGPEAAGGPGSTEPPSARGGEDREERAAPPGRLVPVGGRQAGLPEPLAAPQVTGVVGSMADRFSTGTVSHSPQVEAKSSTDHFAHWALGNVLVPD